ncbi:MAG: hypothetical protein ABI779_18435 [Acidobacteriota bacterium]
MRSANNSTTAEAEAVARTRRVLEDVQAALQGRTVTAASAATLLQAYAGIMKLASAVEGMTAVLANERRERRRVGDREWLVVATEEAPVFYDFYRYAADLGNLLSDVDLAVLDVYFPGAPNSLLVLFDHETGFDDHYSGVLRHTHNLEDRAVPDSLTRLVSDFRRSKYSNARGKSSLVQTIPSEGYPPPLVDSEALSKLAAIASALQECRTLIAGIIREHWTFRDLAEGSGAVPLAVEVTMGDRFQNVSGTIVNRSLVDQSFNRVRQTAGADVAEALQRVAEIIEASGNKAAAEQFDAFNEELQKPEPRKSILQALWTGVVGALPSLDTAVDLLTKIGTLFS